MTPRIDHPKIELLSTTIFKPNPRNARTHSAKQIRQIAASIERFGWLVPIVADDELIIAAGHGRWQAAKLLDLEAVPVIRAEFLTDADRRAFALAENRIAERADIVFGDLPYNVPIDGHVSGNGAVRHREFVMGAGEMSPAEFTSFQRAIFRNCVRFSRPGSIHFMTMDWRHIRETLDAADGVYDQYKQLVVWDKGVGGQGSFYRSQHELVFVFKAGKGKHVNNFGLGETGRYRTNVVRYAGANVFRKGRKRDLADHSTVKPTALIADFLLDCSNRDDLVLDPCLGSGSTLLAAHRTGRRGVGIELDPLYVDTALRRLSDATGLVATLAGDGRSFTEIAAERLAGEGEQ